MELPPHPRGLLGRALLLPFGSGASRPIPNCAGERDEQVLAFLPWGGSCLRSHLSATSMAEAGLVPELSI